MTPLPPRTRQMTVADAFREALRLDGIGRYAEAQKLCQDIIKASPQQADAHHLMGVIAHHSGRNEDAIRHLRQTLKLRPDMPEAALNLFRVYRQKGKWRDALAALETVAAHWPDRADVIVEIGFSHEQLGDDVQAIAHYRQALEIDPQAAVAHLNLGAVLTRRGQDKEAGEHLNAALISEPSMSKGLINLAMLHEVAGRQDDVIATYDRLLAAKPDDAYGHFQRALALLCQGSFSAGWEEYLWRFRRPETHTLHNTFPYPFWQGEPLEGRRLLVWTEQGPGDEILLASMIPDVIDRGASLTLVCSPRLVPLFRRSFKDCNVVSTDHLQLLNKNEGRPDFQASFSHLGAVLRLSLEAFPARRSYLTANPAQCRKLRTAYLAARPGTKLVGIAWHSANAGAERQKSVALDAWGPILKNPKATFVNLQYGDCAKEAKAARDTFDCALIHDRSIDPLKDVDGFAAQVAAMDHVVSVSNTTVHVAGALGIPTSAMIPAAYGRIWYWFLDRTDSPWYPAIHLFRQGRNEGWDPTIAAIAEDVKRALGD